MSLDAIFDDKRVLAMLIACWTFTICIIFVCIMVDDESPFLSFGPNPQTVLFGFKLDTWTKWSCVAMYTFVSTCIADFTSDSVGPWITNTIQDHKNMYIPYSKWTCVCIVQTFSMYAIIMGTIHLFVALSQIDFMKNQIICVDLRHCKLQPHLVHVSSLKPVRRGRPWLVYDQSVLHESMRCE